MITGSKTLNTIYNSVEDVVVIINDNYEIEDINSKGKKVFNLENKTFRGIKCYKVICQKDFPDNLCPLLCNKEGRPNEGRTTIKRNDRHYKINFSKVKLENKETKYLDVLHDITEFIQTETELKDANEENLALNEEYLASIEELEEKNRIIEEERLQYELLFSNMNAGSVLHEIILDKNDVPCDYRYIDCNNMYEKLTGLRKQDIIGKTVLEVLPGVERKWISKFGEVALTGVPITYTDYVEALDKYYETRAYSPKRGFFAVTFHDVSDKVKVKSELEKKNAEYEKINKQFQESLNHTQQVNAQLEESIETIEAKEEILQTIFNSTPSVMILLDDKRNIIQMNRHGLNTTGLDGKQVTGLKSGDIVNCIGTINNQYGCGKGERCKSCLINASIDFTFRTGKEKLKVETEWQVINNGIISTHNLFISTALIQDVGKKMVLLTVEDITALKQKEKEITIAKDKAERADKLKTAFLANMSHEIRTPLNGIMGFTEMLTSKVNLSQSDRELYAQIISKSSNNLLNIVNDILDVSAIESGTIEIINAPVVLNDLFFDLKVFYKQKIKETKKEIELKVSIPENELIIESDENRIKQIFHNLLGNALKFTKQGEIELGLKSINEEYITLYVSDTGIGMAKKDQSDIFNRFYQGDFSSTRKFGGNGLGLSIVKELVGLLGGNIWLKSEPEQGASFYISLPYKLSGHQEPIDSKNSLTGKEQSVLKVLVVEDDQINLQYLEQLLIDFGVEYTLCTTGEKAVQLARKETFDIILMDVRLPGISGLEATQKIREFNGYVPIIAQTAYAMKSDEQKALKAGCSDYISKPIKKELLLEKISKY